MPEFSRVERDGRLLIVTMNRPEVMNALHPPANHELGKIFDEFCADPDLWVAIITGSTINVSDVSSAGFFIASPLPVENQRFPLSSSMIS